MNNKNNTIRPSTGGQVMSTRPTLYNINKSVITSFNDSKRKSCISHVLHLDIPVSKYSMMELTPPLKRPLLSRVTV